MFHGRSPDVPRVWISIAHTRESGGDVVRGRRGPAAGRNGATRGAVPPMKGRDCEGRGPLAVSTVVGGARRTTGDLGGFCAAGGIGQPFSVGARASGGRGGRGGRRDQTVRTRLGTALPPYGDHGRYGGDRPGRGRDRGILRGPGRGQLAREVGNSRLRHRVTRAGRARSEPGMGAGGTRPGRRGIPPARPFAVHGDGRPGTRRYRAHLAQHQTLDFRRDPRDRPRDHDRPLSAAPLAARTAQGGPVPETGARRREPGHRPRSHHPHP